MSISEETLLAYLDGELDARERGAVEAAIAGDPALSAALEGQKARQQALRGALAAHFAPVLEEPVPAAWTARIAAADQADAAAPANESETVVPFARPVPRQTPLRQPARPDSYRFLGMTLKPWQVGVGWGVGLAASLTLGLMAGQLFPKSAVIRDSQGQQLAGAQSLAKALDTQLASADQTGPVRVLVSFRRASGDVCRGFSSAAYSAIACRDHDGWQIARKFPGSAPEASGDGYRQAGSQAPGLMAAAQEMAAGAALDAAAESAARAHGWR